MIVAEMASPEQFERLVGQAFVIVENVSRGIERGSTVGCNVNFLSRVFCQRNNAQIFTGDDRRIHQRGYRGGTELDFNASLRRDREWGAEFPSCGKPQAGGVSQLVGSPVCRVEQNRVPAQYGHLFGG